MRLDDAKSATSQRASPHADWRDVMRARWPMLGTHLLLLGYLILDAISVSHPVNRRWQLTILFLVSVAMIWAATNLYLHYFRVRREVVSHGGRCCADCAYPIPAPPAPDLAWSPHEVFTCPECGANRSTRQCVRIWQDRFGFKRIPSDPRTDDDDTPWRDVFRTEKEQE